MEVPRADTAAGAEAKRALEPIAVLRGFLVLASVAHVLLFVVVALRRAAHPFELEWMEGAMVDHVERVLQGKPLYVEPTLEFVPFIYGPFFYYVAALVAKVIGVGFAALRVVSIGSALATLALIYGLVTRETDDRVAGSVAAGAFAATYARSAQFLDIGRVDSLAIALSLGAVYVMRNLRHRRGYSLAAAVLLGLAFFTKQTSLLVALSLIAHELYIERRRAVPFAVATFAATLGLAAIVDFKSGGWFRYYTWELPRAHAFVRHSLAGFWTDDLFPAFALAGAFGGYFLIASRPERAGARLFHLLTAGGLIACAWSGRLHDGGWPNVLIPAFAAFAVLFGLGFAEAFRALGEGAVRERTFAIAAAITQLAVLVYNPRSMVPTRADRAVGEAFVKRLHAVDGAVLVLHHSYYARMAGKPPHAHKMAIDDVIRGDPYGEAIGLRMALLRALRDKRYGAVVLDDDAYLNDATRTYEETPLPFTAKEPAFYPVTGIHVRPQHLLLPQP